MEKVMTMNCFQGLSREEMMETEGGVGVAVVGGIMNTAITVIKAVKEVNNMMPTSTDTDIHEKAGCNPSSGCQLGDLFEEDCIYRKR